MSAVVVKLDGRHSGRQSFKYFVTSEGRDFRSNLLEFQKWRTWAQDTWGHGCDQTWAYYLRSEWPEPFHWGWLTDSGKIGSGNKFRLYFKSDEELALFKLKWM